ncbi:hypothetical protein J3F83DRAFT_749264 [Trichoderma novae-zelandiae]
MLLKIAVYVSLRYCRGSLLCWRGLIINPYTYTHKEKQRLPQYLSDKPAPNSRKGLALYSQLHSVNQINMDPMSGVTVTHSPYACITCRHSKRRCDKTYPKCTLCTQRQMACDYPHRRKERTRQTANSEGHVSMAVGGNTSVFHTSRDRPRPGRHGISDPSISDILASRFLDPDIFHLLQLETPKADIAIPKLVADYVGTIADIQSIANTYFDTIHTWMPILSKKHFSSNLPNYLTHRRSELCLLVMCMKLSSSLTTAAKTVLYRTAKQFHFEMELSGILSVAVLQAGVLISIYELGHAIYPAAFLSVGQCARYAAALEVDKSITSDVLDKLPWNEVEEQRRVWWSIIILDRYLNLCNPGRPLVTPDPTPDSYLPGDDQEWDTGSSRPKDSLTIGSSSGSYMGRFARFAQTAHLLSQALHTVAIAKEPTTESTQLRRTLMALVNLSFMEGTMRKWAFCSQMAVCFSGILLLDYPGVSPDGRLAVVQPMSTEAESALNAAIEWISNFLLETGGQNCERVSPFLLHFLYKATSIYSRLQNATPEKSVSERITILKSTLRLLNHRWLAAGAYMSLLEKQEMMLLVQNG